MGFGSKSASVSPTKNIEKKNTPRRNSETRSEEKISPKMRNKSPKKVQKIEVEVDEKEEATEM